jgi:hypothetical protein
MAQFPEPKFKKVCQSAPPDLEDQFCAPLFNKSKIAHLKDIMTETPPDSSTPPEASDPMPVDTSCQRTIDASANSVQGDQINGNVYINNYGISPDTAEIAKVFVAEAQKGNNSSARASFTDPSSPFEMEPGYQYSHDFPAEVVSGFWTQLIEKKFLIISSNENKWVTEAAYQIWESASTIRSMNGECRVLEDAALDELDMARIFENREKIGDREKTILFVFVKDRIFLDSVYAFEGDFFERQIAKMGEFRMVLCLSSVVWNRGTDARYRKSRLPKWAQVINDPNTSKGDFVKVQEIFEAGRASRVIPLFIATWFSGVTNKEFEELVVLAAGDEEEQTKPESIAPDGAKEAAKHESVAQIFKRNYREIYSDIGLRFQHEEGVGRISQAPAGCPLEEIKELFWGDSIQISRYFDNMVKSRWLWRTEGSDRRVSLGSFYNLAADLAREEPASYGVPWLMKLVDELNNHVRAVENIVGDGKLAEEISSRPYVRIFANLCRSFMQNNGGGAMVDTFIGKLLNDGERSLALRLVSNLRHTLGPSYFKWIGTLWDQGNAETRSRNLGHVLREFGDDPSTISMCLGEISAWLPDSNASQAQPRALYAAGFMRSMVDRILGSFESEGRGWDSICEDFLMPILSADWAGISGSEWLRHPMLNRALGLILADQGQELRNTPDEALAMMLIKLAGSDHLDDVEKSHFVRVVEILYQGADRVVLYRTRNLLRDLGYSAKETISRPETEKGAYFALRNLQNNITTIKQTIDRICQYE